MCQEWCSEADGQQLPGRFLKVPFSDMLEFRGRLLEWHPAGKVALLIGVVALLVLATFAFVPAIPQWPEYHQLADRRSWLGIPNTLDVISSLPFLVIGAMGWSAARRMKRAEGAALYRLIYRLFFLSLLLTGLGSVVYHIAPGNSTLVWDRLPMSIAFMLLFTSVVAEMVDYRWALRLLPVFTIMGLGSVLYWAWSEASGAGDLRWYGLVQFLPVLLILLITGLYCAPERYLRHLGGLVGLYALSKLLEWYDLALFHALDETVSGHTLKHLVAAGAVLFILRWVVRCRVSRSPTPEQQ